MMMDRHFVDRNSSFLVLTNADLVLTGNAGCLLQIATEARLQGKGFTVMHPMDLLDMSYRGEALEP